MARQTLAKSGHTNPPWTWGPCRLFFRDKAIVFVLLSTGLRREEVVRLTLNQLEPNTPAALWLARKVRISRVRGKGKTERTVYLSKDARLAVADYLEFEYGIPSYMHAFKQMHFLKSIIYIGYGRNELG